MIIVQPGETIVLRLGVLQDGVALTGATVSVLVVNNAGTTLLSATMTNTGVVAGEYSYTWAHNIPEGTRAHVFYTVNSVSVGNEEMFCDGENSYGSITL